MPNDFLRVKRLDEEPKNTRPEQDAAMQNDEMKMGNDSKESPEYFEEKAHHELPKQEEGQENSQTKMMAQHLQSFGRNEDSILAHITPEEAELLHQHGGKGSINPHTGLLEFRGIGRIFKDIGKALPAVIGGGAGFMLGGPFGGAVGTGLGSLFGGKKPREFMFGKTEEIPLTAHQHAINKHIEDYNKLLLEDMQEQKNLRQENNRRTDENNRRIAKAHEEAKMADKESAYHRARNLKKLAKQQNKRLDRFFLDETKHKDFFKDGGRVKKTVSNELIEGDEDGREDDKLVKAPIKGYVVNARLVSDLGSGNTLAGGKFLNNIVKHMQRYLHNDEQSEDEPAEQIRISSGEYVLDPKVVEKVEEIYGHPIEEVLKILAHKKRNANKMMRGLD